MKTIGIVGGVGPEASNKFCEMLIKYKSKKKDQDNLPFMHFCNPSVPDRTEFILGQGEDPVPELINSCIKLQKAGADFLVIPCNTAHVFLSRIQKEVSVPIIDMTGVLVKKMKSHRPFTKKVGILATTGSIKSNLFKDYFEAVGIEAVFLEEIDQEELVMGAIYGKKGIKAGKKQLPKKLLTFAANKLIEKGAEEIVLGCTEIPLVLKQKHLRVKLRDPMEIVAKEIINYLESKDKMEVVTIGHNFGR